MPPTDLLARAARLACWSGPVDPIPLKGGITNANFLVEDRGQRYFVRVGDDIPVHGILRFHELAASQAAAAIGLSAAMALSACSSSSSGKSGSSSGGAVTLHFFGADYGKAGTAHPTQG